MDMYFQQGTDRRDCELKINAKYYNRPYNIMSVKEIRIGGFLGLFTKPGVEVGFYFTPAPIQQRNPYKIGAPVSWQAGDVSSQRRNYTAEQYSPNAPADLEEEKRKVIAAAGKSYDQVTAGREAMQKILESLNEINGKIDSSGGRREEHPAFVSAAEILKLNDFSQGYIDGMLERLRKELPLETLDNENAVQDRLLEWIGESIAIYKEDPRPRKPRIMVLIGPTGVGKTTTVSKLAAIYGIDTEEKRAIEVRMITIDAFRIGAQYQLESTGDIMQIPVSCVDNKQSLRKEIAIHSEEIDLFLVDTIGKSPKDSSKLGEMKEILEGCGRQAEYHLVIAASTKTSDIEEIMRQFEPFNYRSVVITKMDETVHIGNVISALAEKGKPVSYITDGQTVPVDIKKASVVRFLTNLENFKVDLEKIENRFPSGEAEQFKWR
jgi:flagellar biosynthesis protein FlhF